VKFGFIAKHRGARERQIAERVERFERKALRR
jgi:hypothetical protein